MRLNWKFSGVFVTPDAEVKLYIDILVGATKLISTPIIESKDKQKLYGKATEKLIFDYTGKIYNNEEALCEEFLNNFAGVYHDQR